MSDVVDVRISRVEHETNELKAEFRELKVDLRALTSSIAKLAETVAVLGERVSHISMRIVGPVVATTPTTPIVAGATLGGAIGGGIVMKIMSLLGLS